MKKLSFSFILLGCSLVFECQNVKQPIVVVSNELNSPRSFETVEVYKSDLALTNQELFESFSVRDSETDQILVSQFVDEDQDGRADVLLFQPEVAANTEKQFELVVLTEASKAVSEAICYSRFVPERTDDYAWENNRVAFRTYGPTAQRMVEDAVKGGTLSSGIDAWLKRVDYPIINKWYEKTTSGKGSYHKDTGEGLDNFHVGVSRGVGGIAVKVDSAYYLSKNFTKWKTLATGPIRTSFVLEYADWDASGKTISETKVISLDYGSNLSKFEIHVNGTDNISVGLTLHKKEGESTQNKALGYISYWEHLEDSELGTAVVVPDNAMIDSELYITPLKDRSNLYAQLKVKNNKVTYYAGFGWKKSGQFNSKSDWESYLNEFSKKLNNPLKVSIH